MVAEAQGASKVQQRAGAGLTADGNRRVAGGQRQARGVGRPVGGAQVDVACACEAEGGWAASRSWRAGFAGGGGAFGVGAQRVGLCASCP